MSSYDIKKYISLTKILLKNGTETSEKGKKKKIGLFIILAVCFAPTISMLCYGMSAVYDALKIVNAQDLILGLVTSINCSIIFFFGLFYILNFFYFTKDMDTLLSLPLKPNTILSSKFTVVIFYEYMLELFTLLPFLITYGAKSGNAISYYFVVLLVFLFLPVFPLCLDAVIDMIIMRFTNVGKNKDRFKTVAGLTALFLGIGINFYFQRLGNSSSTTRFSDTLLKGDNKAIAISSKLFITAKFASLGLFQSSSLKGICNILLFLALSAIAMVIFFIFGRCFYLRGVIGISESYSKGEKISRGELNKNSTGKSPLVAYTYKELKILFRTPAYFINCVIMNFLWPLFIFIPILSNPEILKQVSLLNKIYEDPKLQAIIIAGGFAFLVFIGVTNGVTSTAISREGTGAYFMKYIPIPYKVQIRSKILSGLILSGFGVLVFIIVVSIMVRPPVMLLVPIIILGALGIIFISITGIILDLKFPKLNWDNEQKAVKQNLNVLFNMLIAFIFGGSLVFSVVKFKMNYAAAVIFILVVVLALNVLGYYILNNILKRSFEKI